jgi:diadenosine tetraphosphate (Ap4A) HIT family hydrolase
MNAWQLDPRLARDSVELGEQGSIQIRAMPAAPWPWLILVPRHAGATELFDLPESDRHDLFELTMRLAAGLKSEFAADKINIGAIGNVVAQLHVHLVARLQGDAAWPAPVWGQTYAPAAQPAQAERLRRLGRLLG